MMSIDPEWVRDEHQERLRRLVRRPGTEDRRWGRRRPDQRPRPGG